MSESTPRDVGLKLFELIKDISQKSHAGHAIVSAAVLDQELKRLLLAKMQLLSNNKQKIIFEGFGPLSEFAAKIEVAHAFGLIDEETHHNLRTIKKIRDEFAHTPEEIHFRSEEITALLKTFKGWNPVIDPFALFGNEVGACLDYLKKRVVSVTGEHGT